ncbi:hypothetical protein CGRA01v4_06327 [Colletotrichum graminicola]|nr:hypothetical protein CGRA01v4_06327 [Colletotrichum graminicola]
MLTFLGFLVQVIGPSLARTTRRLTRPVRGTLHSRKGHFE